MSKYNKYSIKRQPDGSFAIVVKNSLRDTLTIQSVHDTFEEAEDALADMDRIPSQAETLSFLDDLKKQLDSIYEH